MEYWTIKANTKIKAMTTEMKFMREVRIQNNK